MESHSFPVYIVDDDPLICRAVGHVVGAAGYPVRTFDSAMSFLEGLDDLTPGCVVLDLCLPDLDGAELHRQLQESGRELPVIFLTGFGDIPTSVRAIKSGAVDFLQKPVGAEVLLRTIAAAVAESEKTREEQRQTEELARRYATLTPREREVMILVLAGYLNKQVARQLKISEKTVKVHRAHLLAKMGTPRIAVLARYAAQLGLEIPRREALVTAPDHDA